MQELQASRMVWCLSQPFCSLQWNIETSCLICSVLYSDYISSEPLKALFMLCHVFYYAHHLPYILTSILLTQVVTPVWPPKSFRDRLVARGRKRLCTTALNATGLSNNYCLPLKHSGSQPVVRDHLPGGPQAGPNIYQILR